MVEEEEVDLRYQGLFDGNSNDAVAATQDSVATTKPNQTCVSAIDMDISVANHGDGLTPIPQGEKMEPMTDENGNLPVIEVSGENTPSHEIILAEIKRRLTTVQEIER